MTTDPTIEAARVEGFNTLHSIGTPVRYWKGAREGDGKVSRTRAAAQLLSGHTAVVWLENVAGCIALTHVQPITEGEFTATPAEQWPAAATGRSFRTYLDREERDQLDARAAAAEAERDEALDDLSKTREQLADAHAAGARSATQADQLREANTLLIADRHRLTRDLDQTRAELAAASLHRADFDRLAAERDRWRANASAYLQWRDHTAAVAHTLVDTIDRQRTTAGPGDLHDATNRMRNVLALDPEKTYGQDIPPASPVRPGSSRRAQEPDPVKYAGNPRRHAVAFNALTRALRIADRFVALSEREAVTTAVLNALDADEPQSGAHAQGYAEAVARLRDDDRYRNWWTSDGVKPDGPIRQHLADYLETVGPDGVDVETGRWPAREQAVIRAAIAWRLWYGGHYDPTVASACNDLAAAVDALPHIGETARPRIVVLCGSTRFRTEIADTNRRFTLDGYIVLAPGVFGHDGDQVTDEQKEALDDLHFRKIDLADEVYVVNPGGYIGESTRLEMSYARRTRKPVRRLVESSVTLPTYGDDTPGTLRSRP